MSRPPTSADRTRTLWDPALQVGRFYVFLARGVGETLGLPTGLTPNEHGGADVDISTFQTFTQGLYDRFCATRNLLLHDLLRGVLLTSIVMLENGGGTIVRTPEREAGLLEDHDDYIRRMWVD
jgi:hypothetical protein